MTDTAHPLDQPAWSALKGAHARLALRAGRAARYPAEVAPFAAVAALGKEALRDLCDLVPPGGYVAMFLGDATDLGPDWNCVQRFGVIQMVCERAVPPPALPLETLARRDVEEMLALVESARPGPFGPRTIELGPYVGVREGRRLVAMGGERLRPAGHSEVSAICTAPEARGRGLGEAVSRAVAAGIQARGELPFLHVQVGSSSEATAVALYSRIGFRERRRTWLSVVQRAKSRDVP